MRYYINNKVVNYEVFNYYLKKSIKVQCDFSIGYKEVLDFYINYFNDMKYNGVEFSFKDKMSYKIRR